MSDFRDFFQDFKIFVLGFSGFSGFPDCLTSGGTISGILGRYYKKNFGFGNTEIFEFWIFREMSGRKSGA